MIVTIVVGVAENGVIGRDGGLPWRLSTDLKRFKQTTMGKPILMGRKTWESLPKKPLPGRQNIVITRDAKYAAEGADVVHSLEEAIALAKRSGAEGASIIGGGQIFVDALPFTNRLDVTHVLASIDGDTFFPNIDPDVWKVVSSQDYPAGENDSHATRHVIYERIPGA